MSVTDSSTIRDLIPTPIQTEDPTAALLERWNVVFREKLNEHIEDIVEDLMAVALQPKMSREKLQAIFYVLDRGLGKIVQTNAQFQDSTLNVTINRIENKSLKELSGYDVIKDTHNVVGIKNAMRQASDEMAVADVIEGESREI